MRLPAAPACAIGRLVSLKSSPEPHADMRAHRTPARRPYMAGGRHVARGRLPYALRECVSE